MNMEYILAFAKNFSWYTFSLPLEITPSSVLPELLIHADHVKRHSLSYAGTNT